MAAHKTGRRVVGVTVFAANHLACTLQDSFNAPTALSFKDLNSIRSKDLGLLTRTLYTGCSLTVPAVCLSRN